MHDGQNCIDYYPEDVDISILSKMACLEYSELPVYWDGVCIELDYEI